MIKEELLKLLGWSEADYERIKIEEKDKLENPVFDYDSMTLEEAQYTKVEKELNRKCNLTIKQGFDYTINGISYHFYLNEEAQRNFQGARIQFDAGKITTVRWTVLNNGTRQFERIDMDWITFEPISDKVFEIVDSNIRKLRDTLEPQVYAINTENQTEEEAIQQVKDIVW